MSLFLGMNAIAGDMNARSAGSECLASLELTPAGGKRRYQRNKLWSTWQGNKTHPIKNIPVYRKLSNLQGDSCNRLKTHDALLANHDQSKVSNSAQRIESSWMFHAKAWAEAQSHAAKELPVTQPKAFLPHLPKNRWDGHLRRSMNQLFDHITSKNKTLKQNLGLSMTMWSGPVRMKMNLHGTWTDRLTGLW